MTRIDLTRLSPRHQAFINHQAHASDQRKKPVASKPVALGEEFDSMLELDFACELEQRRINGVIDEWRYHPMRFRIAKNVTYEPDFLTVQHAVKGFPSGDNWFTVYEVKGSWLARNARDSRTRLQVAAYTYQWFSWVAVTREKGIWSYETIHANEAVDPPPAA